ncbi:DegT/DnrJ/EryC1/StrS family aminotransferase [Synoicihabitans lomoniglobus]|uniref:DegT/DnrJ/EryC1/StrS family aminotransferase n=1 Tax=Synoicihabitans lomoniglobus TaxID=2909285 RepID=A0AAF0CRT2_9BACT|nr:DegT/DnrJ/EryC1/StrS family aminotransferase [Opitutaceae bacterium LMO-M01]WED66908.1 DegT/DnrJ/EryC1/StrS family aminotransferase [Opitutaceae bacterium LMO-M01]
MKVPFLDLSRPHRELRSEILAAFAETYDAGRFCLGADVTAFEAEFAAASGATSAVGVANGTAALHAVARALNLGPGDDVIVPAFTFIASAWTASYVGAKPVFCDVDPVTFNATAETIAAAITPQTKAIVVVHLFGQAADMDPILALGRERDLPVIEDCAQAHLATYHGRPVGTMGVAGTFSFYPTKNLGGVGEGGAVISQDEGLLDQVRLLRVHGSNVRYQHDAIGYNYRMEGLQAAALRVKLKHLERYTAGRRKIAARYRDGITLADTILPQPAPWGDSVYHQFTLLHPRREALREHLAAHDIGTDLIYPRALHQQPCYADVGPAEGALPVAEKTARNCLSLPIFPELTDAEIDHVITTINAF